METFQEKASLTKFHELLVGFGVKKIQNNGPFERCSNRRSSVLLPYDTADDILKGVPPLERFLGITDAVRREKFLQSLHVGDIVRAKVTERSAKSLTLQIIKVLTGKRRLVKDLSIECFCPVYEVDAPPSHISDPLQGFDVGDIIRAAVDVVNPEVNSVELTLRRKKGHLRVRRDLGLVMSDEDNDSESSVGEPVNDKDPSYLEYLQKSESLIDPTSVDALRERLGISTQQASFLAAEQRYSFPSEEFADRLKERQSHKWSMDMVATGVAMFKDGKDTEALKCFDLALNLCPKNVEALVAKGALKANQGNLKDSIKDFRSALEISPTHKNGRKYLSETLASLGQRYEKDGKWKEASSCYKEVVELNPSYEDTVKRLRQINQLIKQQTAASEKRLKPLMKVEKPKAESKSDKAVGYLKQLLDNEAKTSSSKRSKKSKRSRKKRKVKSKKKRRRKYSSSDSDTEATDSASDSDITSSSGSNDEWIEKPNVTEDPNVSVDSSTSGSVGGPIPWKSYTGHEKNRKRTENSVSESLKSIDDHSNLTSCGVDKQHPGTSSQAGKHTSGTLSASSRSPSLAKKLRHFSEEEMDIVARLLKNDNKR